MNYYLSYPKQTVLITSRANVKLFGKTVEKDNIMTASWHTMLSFDPFLYGVLIAPSRFTHKLIQKSKVFCVNFIPYDMREQALKCGNSSGEVIDKFKEFKIEKGECKTIDCPYVKGACAIYECRVVSSLQLGDHTLFIGQVITAKKFSNKPRLFQEKHDDFVTTK